MAYTNAQLRSILNGFGFIAGSGSSFPISSNEAPLTDLTTVNGIKAFQTYYKLKVDGIAGPITMAKADEAMRILQYNLNVVIKSGLPQNQPFYGPKTVAAVKEFERRYGYMIDGVATLPIRQRLNELAKQMAA